MKERQDTRESEAQKTLESWDQWAKENVRPDLRKPIWRIFDLCQGIRSKNDDIVINEFLGACKPSKELDSIKALVKEALDKYPRDKADRKTSDPVQKDLIIDLAFQALKGF